MADRYCTECGAALEPSDRFCPACGATVIESERPSATGPSYTGPQAINGVYDETRSLSILILIWGVIATASALMILLTIDSTLDAFIDTAKQTSYESGTLWDYLLKNNMGREFWQSALVELGVIMLISGISACVSAHLTNRKQHYTVALVILILSVVTSFIGFITLLIGIYMVYKLSKQKPFFTS